MKKTLFLLLTSLFLFGCNTSNKSLFVTESGETFKLKNPPGTIKIGENLFADKMEASNINYREYLYWIMEIYGEKSETYQKALPDTLVWDTETEDFLIDIYFRHPALNDFPVVGLSYEQALAFCSWRSDRVYEVRLIDKKVISHTFSQDSTNYFSIDRFLKENNADSQLLEENPYPKYRLPTIEEWEYLASGGLDKAKYPHGYDELSKGWKKVTKKGYQVYTVKQIDKEEPLHFYGSKEISTDANIGYPNNFGFLHTIGNVAEMTSEKGIAKGGSWCHSLEESKIEANIEYDKPTKWLGFRCVCSWENPVK
ncbi:MAG: SUMF1/EgtB/PvdO family nonheme iron enzyme [Chitinophagales bacterium]